MKRENFEEAKKTLQDIESRERLIDELNSALKDHGEYLSIEIRAGRHQVYVPVQYSALTREMAEKFHNTLVQERTVLLAKLETL